MDLLLLFVSSIFIHNILLSRFLGDYLLCCVAIDYRSADDVGIRKHSSWAYRPSPFE